MTIPKHTPGPWEWVRVGETCGYLGLECAESVIISAEMPRGWPWVEVKNEANAHLIAAAPDLLAALKEFHMHYGHSSPMLDKAWRMACDAIDKAEGK